MFNAIFSEKVFYSVSVEVWIGNITKATSRDRKAAFTFEGFFAKASKTYHKHFFPYFKAKSPGNPKEKNFYVPYRIMTSQNTV